MTDETKLVKWETCSEHLGCKVVHMDGIAQSRARLVEALEKENAELKRQAAECGCWQGHGKGSRCDKLEAVARAAEALDRKLTELEPAIAGAFTLQFVHGLPYQGQTWVQEREAIQAALTALKEKP